MTKSLRLQFSFRCPCITPKCADYPIASSYTALLLMTTAINTLIATKTTKQQRKNNRESIAFMSTLYVLSYTQLYFSHISTMPFSFFFHFVKERLKPLKTLSTQGFASVSLNASLLCRVERVRIIPSERFESSTFIKNILNSFSYRISLFKKQKIFEVKVLLFGF